ncbi:hypothetical protein TNCV_4793561 [Trichonephila clavipes]|nr:hypothetical protein TNCV_4793561 [Trichonephila clavipes]
MWFQHNRSSARFKMVVHLTQIPVFQGDGLDRFIEYLKAITILLLILLRNLVVRLYIIAAVVMHEMPYTFGIIGQSLHQRYEVCIAMSGRNFEHLL